MTTDAAVRVHFRVCVSGSSGAGKTCLISRLTGRGFSPNVSSTVGVDYRSKTVETSHGLSAQLNYCDLAGQERFRSVCSTSYRNADAVLVVFDLTTGNSDFNDDAPYWIEQARQFAGGAIPILLVANKVDGAVGNLARERGLDLHNVNEAVQAHSYTGNIYYVSAKSGEGTADLERDLCHILEMTERYSEIASDLAVSGICARQRHARGIITGDGFNGGVVVVDSTQSVALLNVVNGADGVPRVVKAPQFVNLVGGNPKKEPGNLLTPRSLVSRAPTARSRQGSDFDGCAC